MQINTQFVFAGTPGRVELGKHWMPAVWEGRPELQLRSSNEFVNSFCDYLQSMTRFEISVDKASLSGAMEIQGAAVVAFVNDVHVGVTLSVEVAYSETPAVGRLLMKEFHRIANNGGAATIRVSKRIGPYNYNVRYFRTRGNNGN